PAQENNGAISGTLFLATRVPNGGTRPVTGNILVIEDDRLNRALISKILRIDGHGVVEACDTTVALEVASNDALRSDCRFCDAKAKTGLNLSSSFTLFSQDCP